MRSRLAGFACLPVACFVVAGLLFASLPAAAHSEHNLQQEIGFDQHIGRSLPQKLDFTDTSGNEVRLDTIMADRPTILVMAWYACDMLCPITLRNLAQTLSRLDFEPGEDFNLVTVGIDPQDGLAEARKMLNTMLAQYGTDASAGWHVLTGDKDTIDRLATTIGFRYAYDEEADSYAHPAGLVLVRADGTIARYLFGLDTKPQDLKFALMETSGGTLGSPVDQLALRCHHFDPERGEYSFAVMNALRVSGGGTVALLLGLVGWWIVRERRKS